MVRRLSVSGDFVDPKPPSLDEVRARLDAIDAELLRLVDERAGLANDVARAKQAAGDGDKFGLRPAREAMLIRRLLAKPRQGAGAALTVRVWREIISDSLSKQGPFHLAVWGAADPARAVELARFRFGAAPPLRQAAKPEDALAAAKTLGGVGVSVPDPRQRLVGPTVGRAHAFRIRRPALPQRLGRPGGPGRGRGGRGALRR
jgi:chorismate mutase